MKIWTIIYFSVLIIVQFFINLGLTTEICGFSQYSVALKQTIIPWLFIFGTINILLISFPNWLNPFSNTIGYLFAYITGVNGFLKSILKDRGQVNLNKNESNMITAINNVYDDKSLLINSMTMTNLPIWWDSMKKGGLFKQGVGEKQYEELKSYIKLKTSISEYIWYALTGVLVTSVSYNSILNTGCVQSAEEMQKRHDDYVKKEAQIQDAQQDTDQIVYKTYE